MFAKSMFDAYGKPPAGQMSVTEWTFDRCVGQIHASDGQGRVLMTISANPLFGPRLAAAFGWPPMIPMPPGTPVQG